MLFITAEECAIFSGLLAAATGSVGLITIFAISLIMTIRLPSGTNTEQLVLAVFVTISSVLIVSMLFIPGLSSICLRCWAAQTSMYKLGESKSTP